jgi:hypothetical protein
LPKHRAGLTLIEITLSIAIGLVMMTGVIAAYYSTRTSSNISSARSMVSTIQTNVAMDKFRLGSPPPLTPVPAATSTTSISSNVDSVGKPYYPGAPLPGALPNDPVLNGTLLLTFDSTASPVPLALNDPSERWDNPVFLTPGAPGGYGKGGWLYDPNTGSFRINLNNHDYPGDRPGGW